MGRDIHAPMQDANNYQRFFGLSVNDEMRAKRQSGVAAPQSNDFAATLCLCCKRPAVIPECKDIVLRLILPPSSV